jgi:hypothetical protein
LVEEMTPGWEKRVQASLTDQHGTFKLTASTTKEHHLRFTKPGYATVLLRLVVRPELSNDIEVELSLAH